jgi:hypothetical protein
LPEPSPTTSCLAIPHPMRVICAYRPSNHADRHA